MKKIFTIVFFFLIIPFICSAKEFIVSDVFQNVFTLKGADFYLDENQPLPISLGDRFIIKKEQKIPLPDDSYYLLATMTHVESGVTRDFTSTTMNDNDWAEIQEFVFHDASVYKVESNKFVGGPVYYMPIVVCQICLKDGSSYHIPQGILPDSYTHEEAKQTLETFLNNLPTSVKRTEDGFVPRDGESNKSYITDIEFPDGMQWLARGERRKWGKDILETKIEIVRFQKLPCLQCRKEGWHPALDGFGTRYWLAFLDHKYSHTIRNPIGYSAHGHYLKLIKTYEDARFGRIFVMQYLPEKKEIRFYINKDATGRPE